MSEIGAFFHKVNNAGKAVAKGAVKTGEKLEEVAKVGTETTQKVESYQKNDTDTTQKFKQNNVPAKIKLEIEGTPEPEPAKKPAAAPATKDSSVFKDIF